MMISRWQQELQTIIIVLLSTPILASLLQYCAVDEGHKTDQCIALSSYYNESSSANDFYLLISAKFEDGKGYAAFGTGETMDGSLMFVIFPGESEGDVTVSLRTTSFHNPPDVARDAPHYTVTSTSVEGSYYNAAIICYSCETWSRNGASVTSQHASWMFSNNYENEMKSNDASKPLDLHTNYGIFELDMTASQSTGLPSSPVLIDNGRQSVLGTTNSNHKFWSSQHLYIVHGILLVFSFIALMPIGMAVIGSGVQNSFRVHWITQITSVITAVSGSSLGVFLSGTSIQLTTLRGMHQSIGFLLLLCVFAQPGLGYLHHVRYLKLGHATAVTVWHRLVGYSVLAVGWANIIFGLFIAAQPMWAFFAAVLCIMASSLTIYLLSGGLRCWRWDRGILYGRYARLSTSGA